VIALHEAQARLLALAPSLPREHVGVEDALGRYLAEPLLARRTQPSARLSAMDGYALATDDLAGPWRVVGESAAGHPFSGVVLPGQAIRISTGALMPDGGAVVLLQEDCAREGDILRLTGTPPNPPHKHIRMPGLDFTQGARLLPAGARVGAAAVALALSAGHTHVPVRRRPRVVVLDSGDELAPRGQECAPHQIPASNGAMLAAMLASVPCVVAQKGPIGDDLAALIAAFDAAGEADIIITSGGASVGDHDLLRPALAAWGAKIDFWRVALRPGKPLLIAQKGEQIIIQSGDGVSFRAAFVAGDAGRAAAAAPRDHGPAGASGSPRIGPRRIFARRMGWRPIDAQSDARFLGIIGDERGQCVDRARAPRASNGGGRDRAILLTRKWRDLLRNA